MHGTVIIRHYSNILLEGKKYSTKHKSKFVKSLNEGRLQPQMSVQKCVRFLFQCFVSSLPK